jgi:TetR/AcrR family transcriptional regulator
MAIRGGSGAPRTTERPSSAHRSRRRILDAAEQLFARRGYDGTSLADIGEAAEVSRGTPSYFFGSKEALYVAVLERLYAERTAALSPVFAPLVAWAEAEQPEATLQAVLTRSVRGYLDFLRARPAFVDIMEREALAGGERLARVQAGSTVMEDAFRTLRARARRHGLRPFDVADVVMCLVALAYMPVAHRTTMLRRQGLDLDDARYRNRRAKHIVEVLLALLGPPR